MTGMLASVNSLAEARLVENYQVDIIDLKQPAAGALGALDIGSVRQITTALHSETIVSATVGDLPMEPEIVTQATRAMAATDVDYVKIGFFPGGNWQACIDALAPITRHHALIAVLFADIHPDFAVVNSLAKAGFRGVMLDTMDKKQGSLTQIQPLAELQTFVHQAKSHGLLTGLAGSLRMADIDLLLPLGADYLGFRGALCRQHQRTASLDQQQISAIKLRLRPTKPKMAQPRPVSPPTQSSNAFT